MKTTSLGEVPKQEQRMWIFWHPNTEKSERLLGRQERRLRKKPGERNPCARKECL